MIHNIIILDDEINYAKKLADYINMQRTFPFEARFFCDGNSLRAYTGSNDIDILLVNRMLMANSAGVDCKLVLFLADSGGGSSMESNVIYKYQNCENIIRQILLNVADNNEIGKLVSRIGNMKVLGFYSPVKRCGQTSLAIATGKLLAEKNRTLFISLEANSWISELNGIKFDMDMSDIMYDLRNGDKDVSALIGSHVEKVDKLDVFPVMADFRDLASIRFAEWKELLTRIENYTDYDYIILDISDCIDGICELLMQCDWIWTAVVENTASRLKKEFFINHLASEYRNQIIEKTKECIVPITSDMDIPFKFGLEIADYAKVKLKECGAI